MSKKSNSIPLIALVLLTVITFFVSMAVGRYNVSFSSLIGFFTGRKIDSVSYNILLYLRLPRTLVSILIGISLSVSGAIYQSSFRNKLVSPDLLGVSSGASVGACLAILLGLSNIFINLFSFVLGLVAVLLTLSFSKLMKNQSTIVLLLSGIAMSGLMSSFVGLLKYLADNEMKLAEMTFWLLGDISGTTIKDVYIMLPITLICCIMVLLLSWRLNVISLGEGDAKSLGLNYKTTLAVFIIMATFLTAGAVSISGTIGWIGLVIPNIVTEIYVCYKQIVKRDSKYQSDRKF